MGHTSQIIKRCTRCRMHINLCVCEHIPQYDLKTKTVLVMHKREVTKFSATGPLAMECLINSETLIHGHKDNPVDLSQFNDDNRRLLFLYPREGAQILTKEFVQADSRPITLIVPDGNWSQASRMGRRLPGISHTTSVTLPPGPLTKWGLRKEAHDYGLATFEAIARAMGIIESREIQTELEAFFDEMVGRVRKLRGTKID